MVCVFLYFVIFLSFIALYVSAAVSAATADDELPGQGRAVPGQAPAICH